ncbi:hypothetical protein Q9189_005936 [Teloschistes chrysophthalmus]
MSRDDFKKNVGAQEIFDISAIRFSKAYIGISLIRRLLRLFKKRPDLRLCISRVCARQEEATSDRRVLLAVDEKPLYVLFDHCYSKQNPVHLEDLGLSSSDHRSNRPMCPLHNARGPLSHVPNSAVGFSQERLCIDGEAPAMVFASVIDWYTAPASFAWGFGFEDKQDAAV